MRILLIRHGDPDYVHDSLTEKGWKEARLLVPRMVREAADEYYVSPLGRAKDTARATLEAVGRQAVELPWLREFSIDLCVDEDPELEKMYPDSGMDENGRRRRDIPWDILPSEWKNDPVYENETSWRESLPAQHSNMKAYFDEVIGAWDAFLAQQGYVREGKLYTCQKGSSKTIALFCHFGVSCVLLSRLWGISPFLLWHHLCMAPSSVTEVFTEERVEGKVIFRATKIGDVSHLYAAGEAPSFAARFCDVYDSNERH